MDVEKILQESLDRYYSEILNYMYLQTGSIHDAYDLTQDAFLKLSISIHQFEQNASLRTWVFTIARSVFVDSLRKKYRFKRLLEKLKGDVHFHQNKLGNPENKEIFMMLKSSTDENRQLIILKHYFGFSYKEISQITGINENTLGVKLMRALEEVRAENVNGGELL